MVLQLFPLHKLAPPPRWYSWCQEFLMTIIQKLPWEWQVQWQEDTIHLSSILIKYKELKIATSLDYVNVYLTSQILY
jgi:hypothetical protein